MPYTTIVAGTTITSSWANANVRDQAVTPFANAAARTSAISSPVEGMVSYLQDVNRLDFYNGAAWQPVIGASAKVVRGTNQVITTATLTSISWSSTVYDLHGMWSGGNPTRLTAPWAGFYCVSTTANWETGSGGKERRTGLYKVGTAEDQTNYWSETTLTNGGDFRQNCSTNGIFIAAGDYFEAKVFHDAGGDRNISTTLTNMKMVYLGSST